VADGGEMTEKGAKQQVRELLDRLPDDCTFADIQRAIAVLMWPKQEDGGLKAPERLPPEEVKRRLREWLKSEKDK
jgi:predicted Rdx family selenoprotein